MAVQEISKVEIPVYNPKTGVMDLTAFNIKDQYARDNAGGYTPDVNENQEELKFSKGGSAILGNPFMIDDGYISFNYDTLPKEG